MYSTHYRPGKFGPKHPHISSSLKSEESILSRRPLGQPCSVRLFLPTRPSIPRPCSPIRQYATGPNTSRGVSAHVGHLRFAGLGRQAVTTCAREILRRISMLESGLFSEPGQGNGAHVWPHQGRSTCRPLSDSGSVVNSSPHRVCDRGPDRSQIWLALEYLTRAAHPSVGSTCCLGIFDRSPGPIFSSWRPAGCWWFINASASGVTSTAEARVARPLMHPLRPAPVKIVFHRPHFQGSAGTAARRICLSWPLRRLMVFFWCCCQSIPPARARRLLGNPAMRLASQASSCLAKRIHFFGKTTSCPDE